jgi:hypothetical protein
VKAADHNLPPEEGTDDIFWHSRCLNRDSDMLSIDCETEILPPLSLKQLECEVKFS